MCYNHFPSLVSFGVLVTPYSALVGSTFPVLSVLSPFTPSAILLIQHLTLLWDGALYVEATENRQNRTNKKKHRQKFESFELLLKNVQGAR